MDGTTNEDDMHTAAARTNYFRETYAYGDAVTALGPLAVLRAISYRPTLAAPVVDLPPEQAEWLRGPGQSALASLDRKVTVVVSSEAETATLREPAR